MTIWIVLVITICILGVWSAIEQQNKHGKRPSDERTCRRCGNGDISYQTVSEAQKRGLLAIIGWLVLAACTLGIGLLLIPLLRGKKTKTVTYAVCNKCGYRWRVK